MRDTAWFVPGVKDEKRYAPDGRVVVDAHARRRQDVRDADAGLPQQHAYDLVFRHALDVDETGTRLVFGSTTGNVWMSEDAGDSWQTVSTTLPPVYAVRFEKPN